MCLTLHIDLTFYVCDVLIHLCAPSLTFVHFSSHSAPYKTINVFFFLYIIEESMDGLFWFIPLRCITLRRMRSTGQSGEVGNVNLSWFHSFAVSQWDCCRWSFADVCTGEDRLEGESTRVFYYHIYTYIYNIFYSWLSLTQPASCLSFFAAEFIFVLLLSTIITCL